MIKSLTSILVLCLTDSFHTWQLCVLPPDQLGFSKTGAMSCIVDEALEKPKHEAPVGHIWEMLAECLGAF